MNDDGDKLDIEEQVDSAPADSPDAGAQEPISEPVAGKPEEDATPLASADPQGLEASAGGETQEVADTSGDPAAAKEALDDAEKQLADQTGDDALPPQTPADVVETAASDDTVMDAAEAGAAGVEGGGVEDDLDEIDDELEEADQSPPAGPVELDMPEEEDIHLDWYILKVQSNRERSIADALRRKIAIEGLDHLFGQVLVPTEKVTEFKGGKKKIVERKLWPGYIAVEMHVNDDTWFAIRETSGIGDFTGSAGKPTPMQPSEVAMILQTDVEETEEAPKLDIKFSPGDKVKVMEGNFENFEGEVSSIDETHGRVTVMLSIFGRPTPVELEYWQVEGL